MAMIGSLTRWSLHLDWFDRNASVHINQNPSVPISRNPSVHIDRNTSIRINRTATGNSIMRTEEGWKKSRSSYSSSGIRCSQRVQKQGLELLKQPTSWDNHEQRKKRISLFEKLMRKRSQERHEQSEACIVAGIVWSSGTWCSRDFQVFNRSLMGSVVTMRGERWCLKLYIQPLVEWSYSSPIPILFFSSSIYYSSPIPIVLFIDLLFFTDE